MLRAEIQAMKCFVNAFRYRYFVYSSTNVVVADVYGILAERCFTLHLSLSTFLLGWQKPLLIATGLSLGHLKGGAIRKKRHICVKVPEKSTL